MCALNAHDRLQENKPDIESSIDNRVIPNDATVKALKSLGATFNFIDIWLLNFPEKYFLEVIRIDLLWSSCSKRYLKMLKSH